MKKLLFFLIIPLFAFSVHNFHLSNTKVVYKKEKQSVQITMRCFIDDIENSINEIENVSLELGTSKEHINASKFLNNYLLNHLNIKINNINTELNFLGNEFEKDIVFFYLEIENVESINSILVKNTVLLSNFEDQQNIIKLIINNKKKTLLLKNGNIQESYIYTE